ncbi:MAG: SDR family oxidoreductase [Bacteroidales bacterium]|nr:SDR family oxidoreductase [Bacteroidales bacterium]MBN2820962.1 SDR family oxidoreductase [Bacteroidales bacterium]
MTKTAIVTGGAQGIGRVIAFALDDLGMEVVVFDNDAEAIAELEVPEKKIKYKVVDVSDENQVLKALGTFDTSTLSVLINNAAIAVNKPIEQLRLEEWNSVIGVNLGGTFIMSKLTAGYLKKNTGSIVNIASTRALMSEPDTEAYSASKGGILSLTHALAASLSPHVRVNAISPGWIEVGHLHKKSNAVYTKLTDRDHDQHPAGRVGLAEDIANMVKYLISDEASFITGQNFVVDGGMTKKMIYE